jgi:hypothetical protein
MSNRVWIEIELPPHMTDGEQQRIGEERAKLMSSFLLRAGVADTGRYPVVWWNQKKQCYCSTSDRAGSYTHMDDNGMWFDLDYLGRQPE